MNDDMFDLVRRSVTEHTLTDDERVLEQLRITCDKVLPPMQFLFRIFGKPCFPRGELVAVTGKAKSGKTLFNSVLMACCTRNGVLQVQHADVAGEDAAADGPIRCLWYDTEQSEQSTQDIFKNRVLRLAGGEDAGAYDVFNVRCLPYEDRLRLFETAVRRSCPGLVVLDGVRDLLADINDGVKAQEIVERLMRLAQETRCCLVCVLHQNKGAEDRNLRGWVGTELMNKAFEVYACEKVKPENIFVVEQTHTRKYDLDGLLFFRMDEATAMPVVCEAPSRYAVMSGGMAAGMAGPRLPPMNREFLTFDDNNRPHPKTQELFYEALKAGPLHYLDLQRRVVGLLNCGLPMWNNMFREMRDKGFIVRLINSAGKATWTLAASPAAEAAPAPAEADLFDQIAAEIEAESLSP